MQSILPHLPAEQALQRARLREQILTVDAQQFDSLALAVFRYQASYNLTYQAYLAALRIDPDQVRQLEKVPFMPIGFFKTHAIMSFGTGVGTDTSQAICFASSGTTGTATSRHYLFDSTLYKAISKRIFEETYGPLTDFHVLALLPSYLERNNSSLVYMVQEFITQTGSAESGFFLHNTTSLTQHIQHLLATSPRKIILIGVTFALLDWAEAEADLRFIGESKRVTVMETGGMKGRRRELLREEVHEFLGNKLGLQSIHSEYGMTELVSQGYSQGEGIFRPGATMRVFIRDINDPFTLFPARYARTGGINVVDLANLDSCSFVETADLGQYGPNSSSFRVMGRFDNSDVRGCNLLVL